ncbi:MAG: hypothetical protein EOO69_05965 [Moraxellaceae bacterium]|nr:MAG: hypothetical protein EOO69_05965 [Moraxellaceae bacterium]
MVFIRYLLVIALFVTGVFSVIQCILEGFGFLAGLIALGCFVLSYAVKPSAGQDAPKRQTANHYSNWLDWIDFPIDAVFQLITLPFRLIGKLFKQLDFDV